MCSIGPASNFCAAIFSKSYGKELKDWVDEQTRSATAKCMELQRELGQAIMHHKN